MNDKKEEIGFEINLPQAGWIAFFICSAAVAITWIIWG